MVSSASDSPALGAINSLPNFLPSGSRPDTRMVTARTRVVVPGESTPSRSVTISPCVVLGASSQTAPSETAPPAAPMVRLREL